MKQAPRQWSQFEYFDPNVVLPKLQELRKLVSLSDLPGKVKGLRTRSLQPEREAWDTAVFCYLLSAALELDIRFCREEDSDYDSIFTWQDNGIQNYAPVQMKELVPEYINPNTDIDDILDKLNKYVDSPDLVVGIKLNREICLDVSTLDIADLPVAEVWLFGATEENEKKWSLFGNHKGVWAQHELELPHA